MKTIVVLFLVLLSNFSWGSSQEKLEIVSLFFNNDSSDEFHSDIDRNIFELARNDIRKDLGISIFRSLNDRDYYFSPELGRKEIVLDKLLFNPTKLSQIKLKGSFEEFKPQSVQGSKDGIYKILKRSYKNVGSLKILVIYGHGAGPLGLTNLDMFSLKNQIGKWIKENKKIDLIIYDSCFLGNIEFLYEMKDLSRFSMASEEAEFSSGQPFNVLESLLEEIATSKVTDDVIKRVGKDLLEKFLASYSTLNNGSQRDVVITSSAVFSLYDNSKFNEVVNRLKKLSNLLKKLNENEIGKISKKFNNITMDNDRLIDLGNMLKILSTSNDAAVNSVANDLLDNLGFKKDNFKSVSPMLYLKAPAEGLYLVYGANNWQKDVDINLKKDGVIEFSGKKLNFKRVNKIFKGQPFLPNIKEFNAFWFDPSANKKIGNDIKIKRNVDLKIVDNPGSLILSSGVTESDKTKSNRYTGISISNPFQVMPNIDYMDLGFQQMIEWLR